MKKKWTRLLKYICGGLACVCIALAFAFMPTKDAAATEIVGVQFQESYTMGDTLNISGEDLKLSYNDAIVEATDYFKKARDLAQKANYPELCAFADCQNAILKLLQY